MKLAVDAMSGDLGSAIVVEACHQFAKNHPEVELYVTGKQEELESLSAYLQVHIIDARDVMTMTESVMAVRRKKESSMVKALMLCKEDQVDGVISCGSTGAYYTGAMLFVKRLEGVEKSCLMAQFPTYTGKPTYILDVGANAVNTASQLRDFGIMGSLYVKYVNGVEDPKVALLNIGTEAHKGNEEHREAYQLLKDSHLNFVGNVEGRDLLAGEFDVIVTDGFSGNIALKSIEGTASILLKAIKEAMMGSLISKIGALLSKKALYSLKDRFDYKTVGGALMIGFNKAVIKAHGSSDATAFYNAMELARKMVELDVVNKMKEGLADENS